MPLCVFGSYSARYHASCRHLTGETSRSVGSVISDSWPVELVTVLIVDDNLLLANFHADARRWRRDVVVSPAESVPLDPWRQAEFGGMS